MADRVNNPPPAVAPGQWERIDGWIAECDAETERAGQLTEADLQRLARKHGLTRADMKALKQRTLAEARALIRRGQ